MGSEQTVGACYHMQQLFIKLAAVRFPDDGIRLRPVFVPCFGEAYVGPVCQYLGALYGGIFPIIGIRVTLILKRMDRRFAISLSVHKITELKPDLRRFSSGRSGITETLSERLWESHYFDNVIYLESLHQAKLTPKAYLGAWRSVNDVQTQLGPSLFAAFLAFVEDRTRDLDYVAATYQTRA